MTVHWLSFAYRNCSFAEPVRSLGCGLRRYERHLVVHAAIRYIHDKMLVKNHYREHRLRSVAKVEKHEVLRTD
jgi:hypothetical protein